MLVNATNGPIRDHANACTPRNCARLETETRCGERRRELFLALLNNDRDKMDLLAIPRNIYFELVCILQ